MNDSHRQDTTASLLGTSRCTYAIEPPCTERYARWCERSGLLSPSYSIVLRNRENVVRVFAHTPKDHRISRVMEIYGDTLSEAKRNIRRSDKARASYYRHISGKRWGHAKNYELVVDSSAGLEKAVEKIVQYVSV